MDEMKSKQEPRRSSAYDDTGPNLPAIEMQVQPTPPFTLRG